jgi:ArsR family transcriptional regulator
MQRLLLIFKALSEETRIRILVLLREEELCVCDITMALKMTQPNISFHLGMLKEAGLIKDRKNGRWMYYSLDESDMFTRFLLMGLFERISEKPPVIIKKNRTCAPQAQMLRKGYL